MTIEGLFSGMSMTWLVALPVVLFQLIALLLLATLVKGNARADEAARAIFSYLVQTAGVIFMTLGGLPALYAVFARQPLTNALYMALLFVFAFGGLAFLWADNYVRRIDLSSRQVPETVYFHAWKFIGFMTLFLSSLTFLLRLLLTQELLPDGWWVIHAVAFFYGVIISWCTKSSVRTPMFSSAPMIIKAQPFAAAGGPALRQANPMPKQNNVPKKNKKK